ncbi:uncharacterized protein M6B38_415100 [Iris pallida]|uniref:BSD2 cysteine rich domain-containing protein n=1 Tax=Iris pallida TaxID=29817 RepID=A0AAX6FKH4_IRIPA|nr:uncharacterized protein M6B38_415100 [Iris pallida]
MANSVSLAYVNSLTTPAKPSNLPRVLLPKPATVFFRNPSHLQSTVHPLKATKADSDQPKKINSILCPECDGNGAKQCSQCEGTGVNSVDHFNGQFKAGALCWLCRGKREILCGNCNGAGFMGGFMNTFDE